MLRCWALSFVTRQCILLHTVLLFVIITRGVRVQEVGSLGKDDVPLLENKPGDGDTTTFRVSVAGGAAIGRLHLRFDDDFLDSFLTNQGFIKGQVNDKYWKSGSILGKSDEYVWPVEDEILEVGPAYAFDHGVSDLVFGDILDKYDDFYRLEFEEIVYQKIDSVRPVSQEGKVLLDIADTILDGELMRESLKSQLQMCSWSKDGHITPSSHADMKNVTYTPRLRVKKSLWQEVGSHFKKLILQRPAIMDIDSLYGEDPLAQVMVRRSLLVNSDGSYKGDIGVFPSLGKCVDSTSIKSVAQARFGLYCGRNKFERCLAEVECNKLGGRWKPKYCQSVSRLAGANCGCCKDIGKKQSAASTERMSVRMHVEWLTPLVKKHECVDVDPKWSKKGSASLYIGMGWDAASDIEDLDVDMSLVPITKNKRVIKDKIVFFNQKEPSALACHSAGMNDIAMRAFADDRTGDQPGDDELVRINLACLDQVHEDVDAVIVMATIFKPSSMRWNMMDSVYMRFILGGQYARVGNSYFVRGSESIQSFVRLSGDAHKADAGMENNALAVGMLFKDEQKNWRFGGLLEGMQGKTAVHAIPDVENMMQGLVYPAVQKKPSQAGRGETYACIERVPN